MTHSPGNGAAAHGWTDAIGEVAETLRLPDSAVFTPHGRRLLVSMGAMVEDPLRVAAERWLDSHRGPQTPATRKVRAALGPPWPPELLEAAERMRRTPW